LRINAERVLGPSGHEAKVAAHLLERLKGLGFEAQRDKTGNVVGSRPGIGAGASKPPVLLSAHMDTVSPGFGVSPVVKDGVVRSSGTTVLGADDKAGVAAIMEALQASYEGKLPSCPIEVAFTVEEETGLTGAKGLDTSVFKATHAVVLDSNGPVGTIVNQAPAADHIKVVVHGVAAHAGVSPRRGSARFKPRPAPWPR
jgi:tripeptide aminopeptidase